MKKNPQKEKALIAVQANVSRALKRLGLTSFVSVDEIRQELLNVETSFQSLLLLGIIKRIMHREDDKAAELFIPSVTEWKNYLPHDDLNGLSPFEYKEKYPPGEYETRFLAGLIEEYQKKLESMTDQDNNRFDINADFTLFQKEYLERIPANQPFHKNSGKLMTLREIIIEERRSNRYPENKVDAIGVELFAENTAEGLGWKAAEIDDQYYTIVKELSSLKSKRSRSSRRRLLEIQKVFDETEPYHRCGPEPHRFYLNYANVSFLNGDANKAIVLLDKALEHKPDYELAKQMRERISF